MRNALPYVAIAALVIVAAASGYQVALRFHAAELADERAARAADQAEHARQSAAAAAAAVGALAQRSRNADELARLLYAADARNYHDKVAHAHELETVRAGVAAGTHRLLVNATCPTPGVPGAGVPAPTGAAGLGDGTAVELAAGSRRAYFRVRDGIAADQAALRVLQDYVRLLQGGEDAQAR